MNKDYSTKYKLKFLKVTVVLIHLTKENPGISWHYRSNAMQKYRNHASRVTLKFTIPVMSI